MLSQACSRTGQPAWDSAPSAGGMRWLTVRQGALTTMINDFTFPFGQPLRRVEQQDRAPKKVFVLGVYTSAVHARWLDVLGNTTVTA
jgi:hypothetical protein